MRDVEPLDRSSRVPPGSVKSNDTVFSQHRTKHRDPTYSTRRKKRRGHLVDVNGGWGGSSVPSLSLPSDSGLGADVGKSDGVWVSGRSRRGARGRRERSRGEECRGVHSYVARKDLVSLGRGK